MRPTSFQKIAKIVRRQRSTDYYKTLYQRSKLRITDLNLKGA